MDGEPFSEEDQQLTEAFGRAAGLVIDQEMLRSNMRELTLSEERERLARDLHDTVIQRLFGVGLALQTTLNAIVDESVRSRINNVLDELDTTIHEIRTTIFEIDQTEATTSHSRSGSTHFRVKLNLDSVSTSTSRSRRASATMSDPNARSIRCRRCARSSPTSCATPSNSGRGQS